MKVNKKTLGVRIDELNEILKDYNLVCFDKKNDTLYVRNWIGNYIVNGQTYMVFDDSEELNITHLAQRIIDYYNEH